ncbi:MAG: hypothetical protein IPJ20_24115 [Flammeovirgaceae bacterium]|nr:hypothetical protein [Flammeovirgaceae bacterium]
MRKVINKALSVNPRDRFQTADKMRHALEQVPLLINWTENKIADGTRWRTSHNNVVIQIKRTENGIGKVDIEVKKGTTKESLRRINRLCSEDNDEKQADRKIKKILQDFVTGKEK